jgi:hypothetical protein
MKNWADIAKAQGIDLSAQESDRIAKALGELERTFQPLTIELTPDIEPAFEFHMEDE